MLESIQNEELEYQKISPEEQQRRGILGRLVGICADFIDPTRNGRHYSEQLWEKTFEDPIMIERIENGVCYGELGHPTGREETDMEKIAVCLPEVPKKGKDGKLRAVFDILDTPNGRILKTLCDYGSKLGVSSRGSGDTYTGMDGNEEVDPDSYTCQGFDVVLIPAVKSARLQYVTESLNHNKSLKESLEEMIKDASEEDKKVMEETLDNLHLNESTGSDLKDAVKETIDYIKDYFPFEPNEWYGFKSWEEVAENIQYNIADLPETAEGLIAELNASIKATERIAKHSKLDPEVDFVITEDPDYEIEKDLLQNLQKAFGEYVGASSLTEARHAGFKYQYGVHAHPQGRDIILGGSKTLDGAIEIAINQAQQLFENPWMSDKEKYDYLETMYIADDDAEEIVESTNFDDFVDGLMSELHSRGNLTEATRLDVMKANKKHYADLQDKIANMEDGLEKDIASELGLKWIKGANFMGGLSYSVANKAIEKLMKKYDCSYEEIDDIFNRDFITNPEYGYNESLENSTSSFDIEDDSEKEAVGDDEALLEELQKALRKNQDLEQEIITLNEKLSVCYAKEDRAKVKNDALKNSIKKLTQKSSQAAALQRKVDTLQESLSKSESNCEKLEKRLEKTRASSNSLTEQLKKGSNEKATLTKKLLESNSTIQKLEEQVAELTKDLHQTKQNYSAKLDKSNRLVEKYRATTQGVVDKYISSQALKLGVKPEEVKNRLPESYSMSDIDEVCEELQSYKLNLSKLPFTTMPGLREGLQMKANPSKQKDLASVNTDDLVDEQLMSLMGLK